MGRLIAAAVVALALAVTAEGSFVIQDDFNDNSLDSSLWWVNTSGIPQNPKSVTETNQHIELEGRAHLNTQQQITPGVTDVRIEISGLWTFVSGDDMLQILTRSDGQPAGSYGETNSGIEFYAFGANDDFTIRGRGASVTNLATTNNLDIAGGDTFSFFITDDGTNLSFGLWELNDPTSWATGTATSTSDMATNYIVFHNRESGRRSNLDDVLIEGVPEPGSMALLALGLLGLARRRRG